MPYYSRRTTMLPRLPQHQRRLRSLNDFYSPIQDDEIERFFEEARNGERTLNLHTTVDKEAAYGNADLVVIATPTNYDDVGQFFDTSAVEDAIEWTLKVNPDVMMVIKSTVPVGYTDHVREKYGIDNIIFSPEFLRESKALYDNLHPSRIVVGSYDHQKEAAQQFADLLLEGARTEEKRAGQEPQDIPVLIAHPTEAEAIMLFCKHIPCCARQLFQRARYLCADKGAGHTADNRRRMHGSSHRRPLQQPVIRLRRILPA